MPKSRAANGYRGGLYGRLLGSQSSEPKAVLRRSRFRVIKGRWR